MLRDNTIYQGTASDASTFLTAPRARRGRAIVHQA